MKDGHWYEVGRMAFGRRFTCSLTLPKLGLMPQFLKWWKLCSIEECVQAYGSQPMK